MEILPTDVIVKTVEHYTPFSYEVFNYLNGNINPYNPCVFILSMFDKNNFAEFRKPNTVTLFLGSIVNRFYGNDLNIKSVILMCIGHELAHSCQNTDMIRYTNDPYYRQFIEDTNEGYTEKWMMDHMDEIHDMFGIRLSYNKEAMKNIYPRHTEYEQSNLRNFYLNTIIDVVYRDAKFVKPLSELFDKNNTILFSINDDEFAIIKFNGEYNSKAITSFGNIIQKHCRAGIGLGYYSLDLTTIPITITMNNREVQSIWIKLLTSNFRYCPLIGIETVPEIENMNKNK